jgi:hypothetical protein
MICIVCQTAWARSTAGPFPFGLLLLMSVLSETLLTLVRCHFVLLSFLTAWHNKLFKFPGLPGLVD